MKPSAALAQRKCLNHGEREAVARCPGCGSHFCRECVSEHAGRVLCAPCLAKATAARERGSRSIGWVPVLAAAGLAFAWIFFLGLGKVLLAVPAAFHDGGWAESIGRKSP